MKFLALASILLFLSGCSTVVTQDYNQYIANNQGITYPSVDYAAQYSMTPATKDHAYSFSSAMGGWGNKWVIKFGDILDTTMKSADVQRSFKGLTEGSGGANTITFDLVSYKFADHHAQIKLNISAKKNGKEVVNKTYEARGISQGGKMFWGGAYAMKNAVQQSTKDAVDQILRSFMADLKTAK